MMGEMKENIRDGLIEASGHLVNKDYDALAGDFVTLGLVPPTAEMGGIFKGTYSLTVLEGIALSSDPNYKVLSSSYPWIARKVLTDKSPKIRSTLQELVYKDGGFRIDRLESLLTESMRQPLEDPAELENQPAEKEETKTERDSRSLVKRLLTFGLTEQGDFVRELILDELAKGIDALSRVAFDSAAHNIRTRSPISLPLIASATEDEDLKKVENLRTIMSIFNKSRRTSEVGTVAGMVGGNGATNSPSNSQATAQDSPLNLNGVGQPTKMLPGMEQVGIQNGAAKPTSLASDNGKDIIQGTEVTDTNNTNWASVRAGKYDLVQRTQYVKPGVSTNNGSLMKLVKPQQVTNFGSNGNGRVQVVNRNELLERTPFVENDDLETALSMRDVTDIVQGLSGLTQYLPLLSVVPELPFLARQQAIFLPAELAGRVAFVAARSIRGLYPRRQWPIPFQDY